MRSPLLLVLTLCTGIVFAQALRTVTQTVFDTAGKPAAKAQVRLSYAWQDELVLREATADAQGTVTWTGLPPVRGMVWGDNVPVGVLPKDTERVTAPLPVPAPEGDFNLGIVVPDPGLPPGSVRTYFQRPEGSWTFAGGVYPFTPGPDGPRQRNNIYIKSGLLTRVAALATGAPMRLALSPEMYLPYNDTGAKGPFNVSLAWTPGVTIHGRFMQADKTPIAGLTRLGVVPIDVPGVPENLCAIWRIQASEPRPLLAPEMQPDGSFTLSVPAPGNYRLLVDLYDLQTPAPPQLMLAIQPGMTDVVMTLPPPMVTVPAGSELFFHRWTDPGNPRRVVVPAVAPQVPVFGPRDAWLAYWYHPTPNTLRYWSGLDTAGPHTLTLRTVILARPEMREDAGTYPTLASLLPGPIGQNPYPDSLHEYLRTLPELRDGATSRQFNAPINLWPGRYYLLRGIYLHKEVAATLEVPAAGEMSIPVPPLPKREDDPMPAPRTTDKYVYLKFPEADYAALKQKGGPYLHFLFDVNAVGYGNYISTAIIQERGAPGMPGSATKASIYWLGVGVLRDVALPPAGEGRNYPTVTLPAWEPGPTVSGTVLKPDGTPAPNMPLRLADAVRPDITLQPHFFYQTRTDAQGSFTVPGVAPGKLIIYGGREDRQIAWVREVPDAGLQGLTLRMTDRPINLQSNVTSPTVWWLPDGGVAEQWLVARSYDLPTQPGGFWSFESAQRQYDNMQEIQASYLRYTPQHGMDWQWTACPLALYLPLDGPPPAGGITVTLTGQGPLSGLAATFRNTAWYPCSLFGLVYTRIPCMPPGDYQVSVETKTGRTETRVTVAGTGGWAVLKPLQ